MAAPDSNRFTLADYAYDDDREAARTEGWEDHHSRYIQGYPQPGTHGQPRDLVGSSTGYTEDMYKPQHAEPEPALRTLPDIPSQRATAGRPPALKIRELPTIPPMERVSSTSSSSHHLTPTALQPVSPTQPQPAPSPSPTPTKPVFGSKTLVKPTPTADEIYEEWSQRDRERPVLDQRESTLSGPTGDWKSISGPPTATLGPATGIRGFKPKDDDKGWRAWLWPSAWCCRLLLMVIVLETVINLAIQANILYRFNAIVDSGNSTAIQRANKRKLPVYLCIFGLAHLFQLVLAFDAVRMRNTVQIIGLAVFNAMFLAYSGIQISEIRHILGEGNATDGVGPKSTLLSLPLNALSATTVTVIAICEVTIVVLTWFIWKEFGWKIYKNLGADRNIKRYFMRYQIFETICRFSAFFFAGFGIQFIFLVLQKTDAEYIITWVALPVSLILLLEGTIAARYENKWLMSVFMLGLAAGAAYFIFKLLRIWQQKNTVYSEVAKSLTVFSALSLVCLVSCAIMGIVVWSNFGKGLKEQLDRNKSKRPEVDDPAALDLDKDEYGTSAYPMQRGVSSSNIKRMSIE